MLTAKEVEARVHRDLAAHPTEEFLNVIANAAHGEVFAEVAASYCAGRHEIRQLHLGVGVLEKKTLQQLAEVLPFPWRTAWREELRCQYE